MECQQGRLSGEYRMVTAESLEPSDAKELWTKKTRNTAVTRRLNNMFVIIVIENDVESVFLLKKCYL